MRRGGLGVFAKCNPPIRNRELEAVILLLKYNANIDISRNKEPQSGRTLLNGNTIRLKYRHGNLVSKANTIDVKLSSCKYRVIVHLDSGYITVDEV